MGVCVVGEGRRGGMVCITCVHLRVCEKKGVSGRDSARQTREKEKEGETRAMTGGVKERGVADDKIRRAPDIPYSSACFCN